MTEQLSYTAGTGDAANWIIAEDAFDAAHVGKCEAIFCQGNGYLGQRAALEERYVGETRNLFVTGTFDRFSQEEVTELPNLPDMTCLRITLGGERFSMDRGTLTAYRRSLDLRNGVLSRDVTWQSPEGKRYQLAFERFVSLADEHIWGGRVSITPLDGDAEIIIESGIDGRVTNSGTQHFLEGNKRLYDGLYLEYSATTGASGVTCYQHMAHRFSPDCVPLPIIDRRYLAVRASVAVPKDGVFTVDKVCCVHSSRDMNADAADGMALIRKAYAAGYDALKADSIAAWAALWKQMDIQIDTAAGYHQLAIRFALYHLNIMVKKDDSRVGIAAKGLSGEGYKGHSFWDTEMFILPYFSLTQPEAARTLLTYRHLGLLGARKKAAENGYGGAMYPWESAWITDGEVTPLWGAADVVTGKPMKILTGILEHHITADIAFAVMQYFAITGDEDFMLHAGYEIVIDTARFWASRCEWNEALQRYEINDVIGPDEYKEHVSNNAYTNYMAAYNLRAALTAMDALTSAHPETAARLDQQLDFAASRAAIERVLARLYLPKPDAEGIIPQFDGYMSLAHVDLTPYKQSSVVGTIYNDYNIEQISGMQVAKQADLLMLFYLLEDLFDADTKRRNYQFYEARTLHDSSLSKNTHCVLACDMGLDQAAKDFFLGAIDVDMGPVMTTSDMGIHSAAMGGIWQCVVYGFGGVRVVGGKLHIHPRLHAEWQGLAFPLVWQGNALQIRVKAGQVEVTNSGDATIEAVICGNSTAIEPGKATSAAII